MPCTACLALLALHCLPCTACLALLALHCTARCACGHALHIYPPLNVPTSLIHVYLALLIAAAAGPLHAVRVIMLCACLCAYETPAGRFCNERQPKAWRITAAGSCDRSKVGIEVNALRMLHLFAKELNIGRTRSKVEIGGKGWRQLPRNMTAGQRCQQQASAQSLENCRSWLL